MNNSDDNKNNYSDEILKNILEKQGFKDLVELATRYYNEFTEAEKKLPYWINVIDAMNEGYRRSGKNENGHTRFLHDLLRYTSNNTLPILNSFMNRFTNRKDIKCLPEPDKIIVNHTFNINGRHPDVYINQINTENGLETISTIFENKIDYADDREEQVEDYIIGMYNDRHKDIENASRDNNCYAFYLIADNSSKKKGDGHDELGRQKVSSNVLGRLISDNHYILLSYKEDILPWLKNEVLVSLREEYLMLNIKLYIQYLDNKFELREDINRVKMEILNNIGMENLSLNELFALQEGLSVKIKDRKKEIITIFENVCKKAGFTIDNTERKGFDKGWKYTLIEGTKPLENDGFSIWCEINLNENKKDFTIGFSTDDNSSPNTKRNEYIQKKANITFEEDWEKEGLENKELPSKGYCGKAWTIEQLDWDEFYNYINEKLFNTLNEFKKAYQIQNNGSE